MDIPDDNHVLRHIPLKYLYKDESGSTVDENGIPYGALPEAYELRLDLNEKYLSVNWLQHYQNDNFDENLIATTNTIKKKRTIRKNDCYAIAHPKDIVQTSKERGFQKVKVVFKPSRDIPCHSGIIRIPENDLDLMQAFSAIAFKKLIRESDINQ